MANTLTRFSNRPDMVPTRSVIDQLLDGSWFAPSGVDRWFSAQGNSFPANLIETEENYVVQVALPGMNSDKLEIQSGHRDLRIKGEYGVEGLEKGNYLWHGLPSGEFTQTFTLPAEIEGEGAEATYNNGILSITLPKSDRAKTKTIPVKTTVS